uniref:RRM domain-containing protein n=1 Tax=Nelumbo nucifera TaxID=4432 RepID=A0A822XVK5_NELNU|nr:TPA_asm: hypothetical protein HUJ06_025246 [Nelumbo nucifera]
MLYTLFILSTSERPLTSLHEDNLQRRDDQRSAECGTPLFQRDSRTRRHSPEPFYPDKSRMGDKNAEPSEVLWIGFPAFLNVDEMVLRKAFLPFGEIEKITAFPGRSYAFVQFRSLAAACRAKEALQGKLFNNPRVNICFAKSDIGQPEHGRNSINAPSSPRFRSSGHSGRSIENYPQDRNFGSSTGDAQKVSSCFMSNSESGDSSFIGFGRNGSFHSGGSPCEQMRVQRTGSDLGVPEEIYGRRRSSPARDRIAHRRDFSPERLPQKSRLYEGRWDFPEDACLFPEAKKLKTGSFPLDKELPEYPFSDIEQDKPLGLPRAFSDFPEREAYDKNFELGTFGYKHIPDRSMNSMRPHGERSDHLNASYNGSDAGSGPSGSFPNPVKWQKFNSDLHQSPFTEEWKWEGTIAKGGTPVCRARCFPVGKVLDMMLPEFLNCTARTGLDMLAKHFRQAASTWVVFFVPEADSDIALYNEFMHYLGEKQRVAVAKLGEKTTLFLVPPSDFSEKVLKVPGKMSISGVILRFQHPSSNFRSFHHPLEAIDSKLPTFHEDMLYPRSVSPEIRSSAHGQSQAYFNASSEPIQSVTYSRLRKAGVEDLPYLGDMPGSSLASSSGPVHSVEKLPDVLSESNENRYEQLLQIRNPMFPSNWSTQDLRNSKPATGNVLSHLPNNTSIHPADSSVTQEYHSSKPRVVQETRSSHYTPGISSIPLSGSSTFTQQESKSQVSLPLPVSSLQPEHLAHLASLLGQKQPSGSEPSFSPGEDFKQTSLVNQTEHTFRSSQVSTSQNHASSSNTSISQFGQGQLLHQTCNVPESLGNPPLQNSGVQEEIDTDPQKRLQATLQLAATLLQQIQQQAKTADHR